jgi:hypothetical protein
VGRGTWDVGRGGSGPAPTRHFVVLSKVWFFIIKCIVFEAYPLLAPKCRVGAGQSGLGLGS